jgi:hypothetical protein
MNKDKLIKELEELRDTKNYSQSELLNTGYRTAILDAIDLVKKLTIPIVSQRSELFADQDSKEFILWQRDMQIQRIDNNVYKWREFTYNRDFFLEKYLEYRNKANCG